MLISYAIRNTCLFMLIPVYQSIFLTSTPAFSIFTLNYPAILLYYFPFTAKLHQSNFSSFPPTVNVNQEAFKVLSLSNSLTALLLYKNTYKYTKNIDFTFSLSKNIIHLALPSILRESQFLQR